MGAHGNTIALKAPFAVTRGESVSASHGSASHAAKPTKRGKQSKANDAVSVASFSAHTRKAAKADEKARLTRVGRAAARKEEIAAAEKASAAKVKKIVGIRDVMVGTQTSAEPQASPAKATAAKAPVKKAVTQKAVSKKAEPKKAVSKKETSAKALRHAEAIMNVARSTTPSMRRGARDDEERESRGAAIRARLRAAVRPTLITLGVLAFVCFALYGPARDYYVAQRTSEALSEQLSSINSTNDSLRQDVQALQTREGIEDEARKKGYVENGDTPLTVTGIPDDSSSSSSSADASTASSNEDLPWYKQALDWVFGYSAS